ncbi:MAG: response regulator transcription factor [Thermoflexales bacterium]|nr:response regulator transcription factor [Thermoflexales bacterium]
MIRVLVVDDHVMVRKGLVALLEAYEDLALAGEAPDGEQAVLLYEHTQPDVVLMDMLMPRMDGIEATAAIRARFPAARIIALTSFDTDDLVQRSLQAGATGYLLKTASADDLAKAIRAAHQGKRTLGPEAADALIRTMNRPPEPGSDLTEREREILGHMVEGLNNTDISARMHLSASTVKFHVSAILSKLGVGNRVEAVAFAIRRNIGVRPDTTA